jgi:chemotaxis signal transduction protein
MNDNIAVFIPIIALSIPIIAIISRTITKMIALKEKQLEAQTNQTAEKAAQYVAHTERLEERVRVLERIATDKGVDVSDEIEKLRDRPLN